MHYFVVKFSKFSSPQAARGHWPPNQNHADVLDCVWMAILLWMIIQQQRVFPAIGWLMFSVRVVSTSNLPSQSAYHSVSCQNAVRRHQFTIGHVLPCIFPSVCVTRQSRRNAEFTSLVKHDKTVLSVSRPMCWLWIERLLWGCSDFKFFCRRQSWIQFTPAKRTRHRQDSFVVSRGRCELGKDY